MTIKVDHEIITDLVKASLFVHTIYILLHVNPVRHVLLSSE